jgi:hypothetical protein
MSKIIINSDDFGKSKDTNNAIVSLMNQNLCKSTTILVNFEDSRNAAKLANDFNLEYSVGIHLNLSEGFPLTSKIKKVRRFCNNEGQLDYKRNQRIIYLSKFEAAAVYEELTCQIRYCRDLGIPISHADSHYHIHEEPAILLILLKILKNENIPFLRIAGNLLNTSLIKRFYRSSYNYILSYYKIARTEYFGSTIDFTNSKKKINSSSIIELMIHPGLIKNNHIFDTYSQEDLSLVLPKIIDGNLLISYNQLDLE